MAAPTLQLLIGTAVTDVGFRKALLNGSRRRILEGYALSGEEIETIMSIQADTLEQFAQELHQRFLHDEEVEPVSRFYRGSAR